MAAIGDRDLLIGCIGRTNLLDRILLDPFFGLRWRFERPDMMGQSVGRDNFDKHLVGRLSRCGCCCHNRGPQSVHRQYQWEQLDFKGIVDAGKYAI